MLDLHHKKTLNLLRENSRRNFKDIADKLGITIFKAYKIRDKLEREIIERYMVLLDFREIGYETRVFMILKPKVNFLNDVGLFLENCSNVNNLHLIDDFCSYFLEAIFKDMKGFSGFLNELSRFDFNKKEIMYVSEENKKEGFIL